MYKPLQPQFTIRVFNGGRVHFDTLKGIRPGISPKEDYIDIEEYVAFPVVYEEQESLMNTLQFTVDKYADLLLYYFYIGQVVQFFGGYYSDSQSSKRHVFSGTVSRIKTRFTDDGRISFSVECMNYGFTKLGKDFKNFVYPDENSDRAFAKKQSLTLEDIIKGIATENNFEIGEIDLSSSARAINFNKVNIRYQKNVSDWKFLTMLAQDFGCSVWISSENGSEKLNFVSYEKATKKQSDISFLFPLYEITNKNIQWDKGIKDSEMQLSDDPAYNRPRLLRDVTVDEDVSQACSVSRSAAYFDKTTGDYKEAISRTTTDKDGKSSVTFYELNEQRIAYIQQANPELADKIRESGPTSLEWGDPNNPECASYYYTAVRVYDEQTAVFDKAFFGITVTAKCNQDLNIHSQRTYRIRGILSYHSKNLESSFFLRGLKHIWDSDGTWTELDFIR